MPDRVRVRVNGRDLDVAAGTTVAAALAVAGVDTFHHSPTGAPRAAVCGMGVCFECRVTVNGRAHTRTCLLSCAEGMEIHTEDGPAEAGDPGAHPGTSGADPAAVVEEDVVVVGAGPGGLAAACAAAEAGRSVLLLDQAPWMGGQIWRGDAAVAGRGAAGRWLERGRRAGVQWWPGATVFAAPAPHRLSVEVAGQARTIAWRKLVLATGARELLLPFPGWTLPGVFAPGGLHALAKSGWPVSGRRIVVAGSGPLLLAAADGLRQHGAKIILVAEQAPWSRVVAFGLGLARHPGKIGQALMTGGRLLGVPYRCGTWIVRAEGTARVQRVTLTDGRRQWTEACDEVACGFNLVPNLELPRLLGCEVREGRVMVDDLQKTSAPGIYSAGELAGIGGADCALAEGTVAGLAAAGRVPLDGAAQRARARWQPFRRALATAFALRPELRELARPDTLFCRCEDVSCEQAQAQPGWRAAKLQTRCGMGACQGRTCGAAAEFLWGWSPEGLRPPVFPVQLASLRAHPADLRSHPAPTTPNAAPSP